MRKYYIYLRGQVKPLVVTENKDERDDSAIKRISKFVLNNISTFTLITDTNLVICRPSDISSIHVIDKDGFSEEEINISKEDEIVKDATFGDVSSLFDKPELLDPEPEPEPEQDLVENVPRDIPVVKIPTLDKPSRDRIQSDGNDFPVIPSSVITPDGG